MCFDCLFAYLCLPLPFKPQFPETQIQNAASLPPLMWWFCATNGLWLSEGLQLLLTSIVQYLMDNMQQEDNEPSSLQRLASGVWRLSVFLHMYLSQRDQQGCIGYLHNATFDVCFVILSAHLLQVCGVHYVFGHKRWSQNRLEQKTLEHDLVLLSLVPVPVLNNIGTKIRIGLYSEVYHHSQFQVSDCPQQWKDCIFAHKSW